MKTEFKEWRIETTDDDKNVFIVDDIYAIAKVSEIQGKEQRILNAKLIAAAPDLYETVIDCFVLLESMARYPEQYPLWNAKKSKERYEKALNAIQKATK